MKLGWLIACLAGLAQAVPPPPGQTGTVTGIVRLASGVPASGIRVTAVRVDGADDALKAMVSLTQTDSTGRYLLEQVPAGRYYIAAGRVDLPTYYPGTLQMSQGTPISISSAATVSNIDFVIQDTSASPTPRGGAGGVGLRAGGRGGGLRQGGPALPVNNPAAQLGLSEDQRKRIDAIVERYSQVLARNRADLEREEATLARMMEAETLEPTKTVSAQIERIVQARSELERTNSKVTLEIRETLTRAQWQQLQTQPALQLRLRSGTP
jgi:Spy/CpxP family protein refolding chaperone